MKILVIEDTEAKMRVVEDCVKGFCETFVFTEAMSYSAGIRKIYEGGWDLVLMDMSLPTYDISHTESGGTKKPVAGKELMSRMLSRKIHIPVIIITQFDTFGDNQSLESLNKEFQEKYTAVWRGTVSYDKPGWQEQLVKLLEEII